MGAIALFGGAHLINKRVAFLIPFTALLLSDLLLGLHELIPYVYGSFALTVTLGFWIRRKPQWHRIVWGSVLSTALFFLITNFGNWACFDTYPRTPAGLLECYAAGIPFLRNGLLGDLLYTGLLFGAWKASEKRMNWLRESGIEASAA